MTGKALDRLYRFLLPLAGFGASTVFLKKARSFLYRSRHTLFGLCLIQAAAPASGSSSR
jgi:hypothetical protein